MDQGSSRLPCQSLFLFILIHHQPNPPGLDRIPHAIYPHLSSRTSFSRPVSRVNFNPTTQKVELGWRPHGESAASAKWVTEEYDYGVIAAPFSVARRWRWDIRECGFCALRVCIGGEEVGEC